MYNMNQRTQYFFLGRHMEFISKYETNRRNIKSKNAFLFQQMQYEIIFCNTETHHKNGPDKSPYYLGP